MADTILDLVTRVHLEPLVSGMDAAVSKINASTGAMAADFGKLNVSTDVNLGEIKASIDTVGIKFDAMAAQVAAAMSKVGASTAAGAREAGHELDTLKEKAVATGETMKAALESSSLVGGFGALFGVGLLAHFVNEVKDSEIELSHLSDVTGLSISKLTQWQEAVKSMGGNAEELSKALPRLALHMQEVAEAVGDNRIKTAFKDLGVDTSEWSKQLPPLDAVLLQISAHLEKTGGSTEDLANLTAALGQRSRELFGVLAQGPDAIQKLLGEYRSLGEQNERNVASAKKLEEQETQLGATFRSLLLPLLEVTNKTIEYGQALLDQGPAIDEFQKKFSNGKFDIIDAGLAYLYAGASAKYMGEQLRLITAPPKPPKPPVLEDEGTGQKKATTGDVLAEWKDEIQQRIEAEAAGDEEAKRLEIELWQAKLSAQKAGSALYLAALRELTRAKKELANEEYRDMVANDRDIAGLAASGSQERVRLEQKALDDISNVHAAGTREYEDQLKHVTVAQQQADEQRVRDEIISVERQVEAAKNGSSERVDLFASELAKLQGERQAALANAQTAQLTAQVRTTESARQADLFRAESFRSYAAFVEKQTEEIQRKFIEAQRQMTEASQKLKTESINQDVTQRITTVQEGPGGIKDTGAEFELEKQHITELAQLDLISKSQAIAMLRQIQAVQHSADSEKLQAERDYISLQMQSLAATGGDVTKLEEEYTRVLKQIAEEKRKYDTEMAQDDEKTWQIEAQNAQRAASVISSSFEHAFGTMLTQHTNLLNVMTKFWNDMVLGWARMGLQIVAQYVQSLAQIVVREILTQTQITAVQTTGMTAREAAQNLWQSFLQALGIKTVTQATTTEAQQTAAHAAGVTARQAADTAGQAATLAKTIANNVAIVTSEAGVAGAAAFASVIAALPFPINVSTAPGVAAAAIAATLANLGLASAAGGMDVLHDQVAMVHKNEMILPANLSQGFRNIISGSGTAGAGGASGPKGIGSGGGDTHNHVHIGSVSLSGGGSREELRDVLDSELVPRIQRAMRTGHLG